MRHLLTPLHTQPAAVPVSPRVRPAVLVLGVLAAAYLVATAMRWPVGPVAVAGATALAGVVGFRQAGRLGRLRRDVSWSVLLFVAGLLALVQGLEDTGVTGAILHWWLGRGAGPSTVVAFLGSAVGSNAVNNLPMTVVTLSGLRTLGSGAAAPALGAALGADVGPNLTPIGSLATLLWPVLLRARGVHVAACTYIRYGALVTLPALAAGVLGLLVTSR